jgi:hypothetical protein
MVMTRRQIMTLKASNAALQLFGFIPEPKKLPNITAMNGCPAVRLPVRSGVPDLPSKGLLKVQGYIHNRVTLCSYQGGSKVVAKRMSQADLSASCKSDPNIYLLRKTRRMLKVGGRWREKCLPTDYTSRAKNMLRDAGYLIETEAGGVPLFLTLTCPGGTNEVFEAFGIASGYIVDRFNRWLRYKIDKGWFGYVWELQERGAPHLHYMFRMQAGTGFSQFYKEARKQWRSILLDVSQECGVDLFEQIGGGSHRENPNLPVINFKRITTKMAGYLSKYASKGRTKAGHQSAFIPGRHWGVSYSVRREVHLRRVSFVLGATCVERQTDRLLEVVDMLGSVIKSVWRAPREKTGPGEYVSIVVDNCAGADVARVIREWLMLGDVTGFQKWQVAPNLIPPAPA